jgi:hypothetical protein
VSVKSAAIKRAATGIAAVGILSAGAVAVASSASASIGTGRIQLCSQGNYISDLTWDPSYFSTYIVPEGTCQTFDVPSGVSTITVGGFYNLSHAHFDVVTLVPFEGETYGPNHSGMAVGTRGTTTAPAFLRWQ